MDDIIPGRQGNETSPMNPRVEQLRSALASGTDGVLDRWMNETQSRCWHISSAKESLQELRVRCGVFLHALMESCQSVSKLELGASEFREPIKVLSFTAGWMAGVGIPVGVGIVLCHALPAALDVGPGEPFESLAMVVAEAYSAGQREQALARHRQIIRKSQVVSMLGPNLAALVLVGDPDKEALEDAVGRLMMLVVMRRPTCLLVDAANALKGESVAREVLQMLCAHTEALQGRRLMLSGLPRHKSQEATAGVDLPVNWLEEIEEALQRADEVEQQHT